MRRIELPVFEAVTGERSNRRRKGLWGRQRAGGDTANAVAVLVADVLRLREQIAAENLRLRSASLQCVGDCPIPRRLSRDLAFDPENRSRIGARRDPRDDPSRVAFAKHGAMSEFLQ